MKRFVIPVLIIITISLISWKYFSTDPGGILISGDIAKQHPGWAKISRPIIREFRYKMDDLEIPLTLTAHTAADSQGVVHIIDFVLSRKPSPARLKLENLTYSTTCCTVAGGFGRYNTFEKLQISGNFEGTKNLIYNVGVHGVLIELNSNGDLEPQLTTSEPGTYSWKHGQYVKEKGE